MKGIDNIINLFTDKELELIHEATLMVLEDPGMKIVEPKFLIALENKGARVDYKKQVVKFPRQLIEETIKITAMDSLSPPFSREEVSSRSLKRLRYEIPGPFLRYFDYDKGEIREGTERDALTIINLGDAIEEVSEISPPLSYSIDLNGEKFDPRLWPIKGLALLVKHTSKLGHADAWTLTDLKYLIKIGCVLKGGWEEYKKAPIPVTRVTKSPLILENPSAEMLLVLAEKGFPCKIVSMPITGATSPVTPASCIVIANAEILGVMAAVKSINPKVPFTCVCVSGVLDMSTSSITLTAPEGALQDMGLSQLYGRLYKLNCPIPSYYLDGKYVGIQAGIEKALMSFRSAIGGWKSGFAGGICQGQIFSPEQMLIDIEIGKWVDRFFEGIEINEETLAVDVIRRVGIGGHFIEDEHTFKNFKQEMWFPRIFDRTRPSPQGLNGDKERDMFKMANQKVKEILQNYRPYVLDKAKSEEIDRIVKEYEMDSNVKD